MSGSVWEKLMRGECGVCRHWIGVARRIERGQAGEELFELRYGAWAERHELDLGT